MAEQDMGQPIWLSQPPHCGYTWHDVIRKALHHHNVRHDQEVDKTLTSPLQRLR